MASHNDSNSAPGHKAGGTPFGQGRSKDGQSRSAHTHSAEKAEADILRRVPPHSVEAEQAVLGGVFMRPQLMHSIVDQLTDEDFYLPAHATIYRAFLELYRKSAPLDLIATAEQLKSQNALEEAGVIKTKEAIEQSQLLAAQTQSVQQRFDGFKSQLAGAMMPVLNTLAQHFLRGGEKASGFGGIIQGVGIIAKGVAALTKDKSLPSKELQMRDSLERLKKRQNCVALVKLADRITNLDIPPKHWDAIKKRTYLEEAKLILKELGYAHTYLARKLQTKIEAYALYM